MALLLSCQSLTASFGATPLFEDISLGFSDGDRVGLIGPTEQNTRFAGAR